jgi:transcriptional regulator with XRE-family HTH domain
MLDFDEPDDRSAKQKAFRKQFAERLNAALDRHGVIPPGYGRVIGAAELFGVSQNTAAAWLKGDGVPELARLPEIADILGTTIEQLVVGDHDHDSHLSDEHYVSVDLHTEDSVGGYSWHTLPETLRILGLANDIEMLQISNDDMAPFVRRADVVIYDPRVKRIHANGIYVLKIDQRFIVRRVQRGVKQTIRLICDNPAFNDEVLENSEFTERAHEGGRIAIAGQMVGRILVGG